MEQLEFDKIINILTTFAVTELGKKRCKKTKPCGSFFEAEQQLDLTQCAVDTRIKLGSSPIRPFSDISDSVKRASIGGSLGIGQIMKVGNLLSASHTAKKHLIADDIPMEISSIASSITLNERLQKDITECFISENEVSDSASEQLRIIRRKMHKCQGRIRDKLSSMISSSAFAKNLQDPIITMRNGKFVLPVKSECRGNVLGVLHDQSASGQTVFIEPMAVVEINNELIALTLEERAEIERILEAFSARIGEIADELNTNAEVLVTLDVLFAKAAMAAEMKASRPVLSSDGIIDLKQARHPLIDADKVVPVDVTIKKDIDCLLITGPNTGGKTVTLKTIGLFALMAKSGMFICADINSKISFFSNIYVDIGDIQSIEQSLSTFSGHIKRIVDIFDKVQQGDLCLLDELGAGTDPIEGAALATAIVDVLIGRGVKVAATTHYAELKAFAIANPRIENAGMEFDINTLSPTYKLITGLAGKSNAFLISKRLGLEDEVINNARERMGKRDVQFENVISSAEKLKTKAIRDLEKASALKADNEKLNKRLKDVYDKQQKEYKRIVEKAKEEAKSILEQASDEAKEVIKDIRKIKVNLEREDEQTIQKGGQRIKKQLEKVIENELEEKGAALAKNLKAGDVADLMGVGKVTIVEEPDSKGNVVVMGGSVKFTVKKDKLYEYTGAGEKKKSSKKANIKLKSDVKQEIMLLGKNIDDACLEIDKCIDDALLCNIKELRLVHGKGTGALRKGIHSHLKRNRYVDDFRLAAYGEGDSGVTIVTLK